MADHIRSLPAAEVDRIRTESLVFVMFTAVAVSLAGGVPHEVLTEFHTSVYRRLAEVGILSTPEDIESLNHLANDRYGGYYETLSQPMSREPVDDLGNAAAMLIMGPEQSELVSRIREDLSRLFLSFGQTVMELSGQSSDPE